MLLGGTQNRGNRRDFGRLIGKPVLTRAKSRWRSSPTILPWSEVWEDSMGRRLHRSEPLMSKSHIRRPKQPPQPVVWWRLALGAAILAASFAALCLIANWVHSFPSTYETANGKILEIRKVVDGTRETGYGGTIVYGAEARVQYKFNGQTQDRWLRASDDLARESLLLKLAAHPTECHVYWPPNHPENAKCSLESSEPMTVKP